MSTQRIIQLFVSFGIITLVAFLSEKSRVLASILSVFPVNITIALWFVFNSTNGDTALSADFIRMVFFGLFPVMFFTAACWFGFRQGWSLGLVLIRGNVVWLVTMGIYRGIEWWVRH